MSWPSSSGSGCSPIHTPPPAGFRPRPGYRLFVDELLSREEQRPAEFPLELPGERAEIEEALQATTEMLSQVSRLLALVSAPPLEAATVRHVEVLLLQPNVVMVVVITSAGGVTKLRYVFADPVDSGLTTWAAEYLNERLVGCRIGSRTAKLTFAEPSLSAPRTDIPVGDPRRVRASGRRGPSTLRGWHGRPAG